MIPFLTYPLALLAMASLPALAAIYLLRNRFRRRQVSSLMLWRFRVQSKEGGSKVNRLQLPLLFFLELLALILLVTAATGPHWKLPQATRPLIIVLDDSLSMRAAGEEGTAKSRATEALRGLFRFQPPRSTRVILAGAEPRLAGGSARNWREVETLLEQWTCWSPASSIDPAVTLASEIGQGEANILVLTDSAPASDKIANDRLRWRAFGQSINNLAIVNAARTINGDEDRCLIEVANFSKTAAASRVIVRAGSNDVRETALSLASGQQERLVFNLPAAAPSIDVTLDPDPLVEDNSVQLLPPLRKRVRVQVALTNAAIADLMDRTLAATGLRAAISESPQLLIHHSDAAPGSNAWSLRWNIPGEATAYTGPFMLDGTHPLAEGLAMEGAVWAAAPATNPPGAIPVILAGNVPLLSAREDLMGRQFLTLNLDPELSTVVRTPDWPALFYNLLDWRIAQMPGLADSNARLGTEVVLKASGQPVTIRRPDGTEKRFASPVDRLSIETPLPGIYTVVMGATNAFSVNVLAADESNLQSLKSGEWGGWKSDPERRYEQSPLAWLFALLALGVLTAHLWLVAAGKGAGG